MRPVQALSLAHGQQSEGYRRVVRAEGRHRISLGLAPSIDSVVNRLCTSVHWPPGHRLNRADLHRFWVGRHKRVTFELRLLLDSPDGVLTRLVQGGCGASPDGLMSMNHASVGSGWVTGLALADDRLQTWLRSPDRDPRLPGAAYWLGPTARSFAPRIVAYRVGRRCVLQIPADSSHALRDTYIKCYRRVPWAYDAAHYGALANTIIQATQGLVRLPELARADGALKFIATRAIPEVLTSGRTETSGSRAAQALHALHSLSHNAAKGHTITDELRTVGRWVSPIVDALPALAEAFRELVAALARTSGRIEPIGTVLVHKDYYPAQLLDAAGATWIADLDTLASGHPEVDIATYASHRVLDAVSTRPAPDAHLESLVDEFVESYRIAGGRVSESRLRFYLGCALARLGAIHAFRGLTAANVGQLWQLARATLGS